MIGHHQRPGLPTCLRTPGRVPWFLGDEFQADAEGAQHEPGPRPGGARPYVGAHVAGRQRDRHPRQHHQDRGEQPQRPARHPRAQDRGPHAHVRRARARTQPRAGHGVPPRKWRR
ncbi:hypothetical protein ABZ815_03725 [Nonomuraea sp. NPDC047529]|uniref:hypothetical protein n=1 Tax=Nonomuraea sp. NPDC047529 TaxID=3155623 RepID=UPI0033D76E98